MRKNGVREGCAAGSRGRHLARRPYRRDAGRAQTDRQIHDPGWQRRRFDVPRVPYGLPAERAALRADEKYGTDAIVLMWLNRLSDYFYLLGRTLTEHYGVEETLWIP